MYVNTTTQAKDIAIEGQKTGLLSGATWTQTLHLGPNGVELLQ